VGKRRGFYCNGKGFSGKNLLVAVRFLGRGAVQDKRFPQGL
jgi:hypothetical protein